jgi:predicted dehydrogenase
VSDDGRLERRRLRVAVIGSGFAASSHVDALSRVRAVEIAGIVGSSAERARAAAERFSIDRAYGSLDDALSDPSVDAVHNCTPNDVHAEITTRCLDAGKHVLAEKPLAMDSAQSGELVTRAAAADVVTGVAFNYRHYPLVQQLRMMLSAGEHGAVHLVTGGYLQDWLLHRDDWNWRLESARAGSTRAVGDIGSHWLDLVQHVTGDPIVEVMADLGRVFDERVRPGEVETFSRSSGEGEPVAVDTEDFGSVLLRFASGARGAFTVSQVSAGRKNHLHLEVDTAEAAFAWDQEEPNALWIGRRDEPNLDLVRDPSLLAPEVAPLAHYPGGHQEGWPDGLRNLLEDFYAAIAARLDGGSHTPTFATFGDADRVMRIVEAIAESDRRGAWVSVTS